MAIQQTVTDTLRPSLASGFGLQQKKLPALVAFILFEKHLMIDMASLKPRHIKATISMIAATSRNRVIGHQGGIPWQIQGEQANFRKRTLGKTVIMGRATYDSIPKGLPGRKIIVLSRSQFQVPGDTVVVNTIDVALDLTKNEEEVFIAGGQTLYEMFLPICDKIYLTEIDAIYEGDTFFPEIRSGAFKETAREYISGTPDYYNVTYERID